MTDACGRGIVMPMKRFALLILLGLACMVLSCAGVFALRQPHLTSGRVYTLAQLFASGRVGATSTGTLVRVRGVLSCSSGAVPVCVLTDPQNAAVVAKIGLGAADPHQNCAHPRLPGAPDIRSPADWSDRHVPCEPPSLSLAPCCLRRHAGMGAGQRGRIEPYFFVVSLIGSGAEPAN